MSESQQGLSQLIPTINALQDVFAKISTSKRPDLPQIAVVGAQSSGKSSVLENIVGRDFLPRGSGIVTRRPLILQLVHLSEQEAKARKEAGRPVELGKFLHQQGQVYTDFKKIKEEIEAETNRLCGNSKNVMPDPIRLTVESPTVIDLTLIDLPGLTKVAVDGQPEDVAQQIEDVVLQYITPKNTIIVAVTAANTDIANSDALQIARRVDPNGERTVGVLTKLDLMDAGTDAMDVLQGQVIRLKKGFIGIVNRSQNDILTGKNIQAALTHEESFFHNHPVYAPIAKKMGTKYLTKALSQTLLLHIQSTLPKLRADIQYLLNQAKKMVDQYGPADNLPPGSRLLSLITEYTKSVVEALDGTNTSVATNELLGGAKINHIFTEGFVPFVQKMNPLSEVSNEQIRAMVQNCQGTRPCLFIPEQAFENLARLQISTLEPPAHKCCDHVFDELLRICEAQEVKLQRYPNFKNSLAEFVQDLLKEYREPLRRFVTDLFEMERAYINTGHQEFYGGGSLDELLQSWSVSRQQPGNSSQSSSQQGHSPVQRNQFDEVPRHIRYEDMALSEKERKDNEIIRHLVATYFNIVRKHIQDHIPKAIMCFLVNKVKEHLQKRLVEEFYKEGKFGDLLHESEEVVRHRKAAENMYKCLSEAVETLNKIRDRNLR